MIRKLLFTFFLLPSLPICAQLIAPTGTYKLISNAKIKDGETYGYTGEILVKQISNNKVVLRLSVNRGAPSYNAAYILDTLSYANNKIIYTCAAADPSCKITFSFSKKGITVVEDTADFNNGCGFGHAVVVSGVYKRVSSKVPSIQALER